VETCRRSGTHQLSLTPPAQWWAAPGHDWPWRLSPAAYRRQTTTTTLDTIAEAGILFSAACLGRASGMTTVFITTIWA
jgi:hypothetical protein